MQPSIQVDARKLLGRMNALPEDVRTNLRRVMPALGKKLGAEIEANLNSRLNSRNRLKVTKLLTENPREIKVTVRLDWTGDVRQKLVPTYLESGTRPHEIIAKNAAVLAFYWPKIGGMFFGPRVSHPGTKAYNLVADAWTNQRASIEAAIREAVLAGARAK